MKCQCINWARLSPEETGQHHHKSCPKYATEKFSRLFYFDHGTDYWAPAPDRVENILDIEDFFYEGEIMDIQFRRVDMTDKEYDELPED